MKRKLAGCSITLAGIALVFSAVFFSSGTRMVSKIEEANKGAETVLLERYLGGEVVNRSAITPQNLNEWISSNLKSRPPLPFDVSMCWKPHHRIILQGEETRREIEICFECNLFKFESSQRPIPRSFKEQFRSLFTSHGIPATTPDDDELDASRKKSAEQVGDGKPDPASS
jgi:hypothetical protein